jgi:hypothetical protein
VKRVAIADVLAPGAELPFAWDEPTAEHTLCVVAQLRDVASGTGADEVRSSERFFDIDQLASQRPKPIVICSSSLNRQEESVVCRLQEPNAKMRRRGALSSVVRSQVCTSASSLATATSFTPDVFQGQLDRHSRYLKEPFGAECARSCGML